jgi:hypothetical protein
MRNTRNYRPTIGKKWTATRVMSVQDALDMGKIMFSANERGNDSVLAYIDFDEALTVCNTIIGGSFSAAFPANETRAGIAVSGKFTNYGGTKNSARYNGGAESRIIEIIAGVQEGLPKWAISVRNSEGQVTEKTGMISPKTGANVITQTVYFTHEEMIRLVSKIRLHVEAYYINHLEELYDENGEWSTERRLDIFATESAKNYDAKKKNESLVNETESGSTSIKL